MPRTAVIDGDIIVYKAGEAALEVFETELEEDENFIYRITSYANKLIAVNALESMIDKILKETRSDKAVICLSDSQNNFRKEINPDYKGLRKKKLKPVLYQFLRHYFENEAGYKLYERPYLEADDVIGILATDNKIIKGDKCIWSYDKDFNTIPCKFAKGFPGGKIIIKTITPIEADWYFMYQTLKGDITDGYKGCPKIGDKKAKEILGEAGEKTLDEMWESVVQTYIKCGLSKEDALLNARMARILRAEDYDFKKKEIKLWQPNRQKSLL